MVDGGHTYALRYPTRLLPSAFVARGFVRFVNVRPDRIRPAFWICDECGSRVTPARQTKHAKDHR